MKNLLRLAPLLLALAASPALAQSFTGPATISQPTTANHCVKIGPNGGNNVVDAGAGCGTGSGTISSLTGDVTASGTGAVAATVNSHNGGTPFGTAADAATGTSGATLCLLSTACAISASHTYTITGTAPASAITGSITETITSNIAGPIRAFNVSPHVSATSTANLTAAGGGLVGMSIIPTIDNGAAGTVTTAVGIAATISNASATETIGTAADIRITNATATGPITNLNGIVILSQTTGASNTDIAVGCPGTTSGNFGILQCDAYANSFGGTISFTGTIPVVTGTGTPTINAGSTDTSGRVMGGTAATSIVITFSSSKSSPPFCHVSAETQVAAFAYTVSNSAINITLPATTGEAVNYSCTQH